MSGQFLEEVSGPYSAPINGNSDLPPRSLTAAASSGRTDLRRSDRRQDRRELLLEPCTYELFEARGCETLAYERGEAYTLNRSRDGIMLLMDHAPRASQYLEVHTEGPMGRHEISVCEVAWTRPLPLRSDHEYHMVGCYRVMEPCRYLQF